jgi:hypothetical protein
MTRRRTTPHAHAARSFLPALLAFACASSLAARARAQPGPEPPPLASPGAELRADSAEPPEDTTKQRIDRTWLYVDDARIPAPLKVIGTFTVSYTNVGSPTRIGGQVEYNSFALNTAQPGAMFGVGGEIGLFSHVSIMTIVDISAGGEGPSPSAGLVAGVRVQAFPSRWRDSHLVISAGYLREAWQGPEYNDDNPACTPTSPGCWSPGKPYGDSGAWIQASFSQDLNRVRLAATVHGEHVFATGRDPLDIMVQAGASVRIVGGFRLGAEYVGQDLEESIDPGSEGGARHFAGPTASLQILKERLSLVAGPSFGLNGRSPEVLGRGAASFGF